MYFILSYKSSIYIYILSISIKKKKKSLRDTYISTCKWNKYSSSQTTSPPDLFAIKEKLRTTLTRIVVSWNAKTITIVIDEGLRRRREGLR